jgi:ketosteroid isomerase-like protein
MSTSDNLEVIKKAYAAFSAGDVEAVVSNWDDDLEWFIPGNSKVSGTYHGKDEVLGFFAKLAEKSFTTKPSRFLADDDVVVVLAHTTVGEESDHQADVFTFRDGKIVKAESVFDTAQGERIWGTK